MPLHPTRDYAVAMSTHATQSMAMIYHIRVQGHLDPSWSAWFDGFTITNEANGTAMLTGSVVDQAALHGVLLKIRDLGLPLLAVCAVTTDEAGDNPTV